jgi:hypothetical protein
VTPADPGQLADPGGDALSCSRIEQRPARNRRPADSLDSDDRGAEGPTVRDALTWGGTVIDGTGGRMTRVCSASGGGERPEIVRAMIARGALSEPVCATQPT